MRQSEEYWLWMQPDFPRKTQNTNIVSAIQSLRESLGVTETLSDLGVSKKDIPELAKKAKRDPCLATNPRTLTVEDIERIYERAL